MWQMCMRNHIPYRGGNQRNSHQEVDHKKTRNCWKFNKGVCTDNNCKFPHKCNYCDGRHGIHNCFKRQKRNSNGSDKYGKKPAAMQDEGHTGKDANK